MKKIRILVADDHEVVRRGLVLVLKQEADFEIVGEAHNGVEAVDLAEQTAPDLILLDWKMPALNGLKASRKIKDKNNQIRTLVLSGAPVETAVLDALDQGVDGFIHKDVSSKELAKAIRIVATGGCYLSPKVLEAKQHKKEKISSNLNQIVPLSPRELEITYLMSTSATYKEMAYQLNISETTIHTYVKRIFNKLNQPNRTQAVISAYRLGLIQFEK